MGVHCLRPNRSCPTAHLTATCLPTRTNTHLHITHRYDPWVPTHLPTPVRRQAKWLISYMQQKGLPYAGSYFDDTYPAMLTVDYSTSEYYGDAFVLYGVWVHRGGVGAMLNASAMHTLVTRSAGKA